MFFEIINIIFSTNDTSQSERDCKNICIFNYLYSFNSTLNEAIAISQCSKIILCMLEKPFNSLSCSEATSSTMKVTSLPFDELSSKYRERWKIHLWLTYYLNIYLHCLTFLLFIEEWISCVYFIGMRYWVSAEFQLKDA